MGSPRSFRFLCAVVLAIGASLLHGPAGGSSPVAAAIPADALSSTSYVESRTRLLGPLPEDPIAAAKLLVADILGPDDDVAQVATMELLRQSGVPVINLAGNVIAMPDAPFISNGPIIGEYLPNLTRSVRAGDFYPFEALPELLVGADIATELLPSDRLLASIPTWGKTPDAPRPSVVASTAVRELSASRGEPLYAGLDPMIARLDLLQTTLLMDHLGGVASEVDAAVTPLAAAAGDAGSGSFDCRAFYDGLGLKVYKGTGSTFVNTLFKDAFFTAAEGQYPVEIKSLKDRLKYVDYASKAANTLLFITSVELTVTANTVSTHFRHDAGDTSRDVHLVATAEWKQGDTLQEHRCLQGLVGIDSRANGPFPGLRVHWSLDQPLTGNRTGKLLRAKAGQAAEFTPGGAGGEITDAAGQSDVDLEPAVEPRPGQGTVFDGKAIVYAALDKDEFPDLLKNFLENRKFITDPLKFEGEKAATNWAKFLFDQALDISLKAIKKAGLPVRKVEIKVGYHGRDVYSVQGTVNPFLLYYVGHFTVNAYSCDGPAGPWVGELLLEGDDTFFKEIANLLGGQLPADFKQTHRFRSTTVEADGNGDLPMIAGVSLDMDVDAEAVKNGHLNVGTARFLMGGQDLGLFQFADPGAGLPIQHLTPTNATNLDAVCPGSEGRFP